MDNPPANRFCDKCGLPLTRNTQSKPTGHVQPVESSALTPFDNDVLVMIYNGETSLLSLSEQCRTTKQGLLSRVEELEAAGFLEITKSFPYRRGDANVHLTPQGYNRVKQLLSRRQPEPEPSKREPSKEEASATAPTPPPPVEQHVTVKSGGDGWKVCGYACLIAVVFCIIIFVIATIEGIDIVGRFLHLLGLG